METVSALKDALRRRVIETTQSATRPLSDAEYDVGFTAIAHDIGKATYDEFIIPQLSQLLAHLLKSHSQLAVLEIGPGPRSVLGSLPDRQKHKIKRYAAFEPNKIFARQLGQSFSSSSPTSSLLPSLMSAPNIQSAPFCLQSKTQADATGKAEKFDVILFCHSMYGMEPKSEYVEKALEMLNEEVEDAMVVIFHRHGSLHLDGLVCHFTASFPNGVFRVPDKDKDLDCFARFAAGVVVRDVDEKEAIQKEWRSVCRLHGRSEHSYPDRLCFDAPNIMMTFTKHATTLDELTDKMPAVTGDYLVKNREARQHRPALIVKPHEIQHIQHCVHWALKNRTRLTIVGGGHGGHCLQPNVVAIDMGAFNKVHIVAPVQKTSSTFQSDTFVIVDAGCKAGDVIRTTMAAGLTVPLGSRPSVGAGLWLQGGIGHLARLHGLACDAIVGAVIASVASGQLFCVGQVPVQYRPSNATCVDYDSDLMWALKGAGTNFGIVVSVTFKTVRAGKFALHNWIVPLNDEYEVERKLAAFDHLIASKLPRHCSADAYLYSERDQLHLGISMCHTFTGEPTERNDEWIRVASKLFEEKYSSRIVDGIGLFDTEMYMSGMHGGHAGGKTSSFKRCVFLKHIATPEIVKSLLSAMKVRPSPQCYFHLLQGGGAVGNVPAAATAFGCRDWDFACVITGVWDRNKDNTAISQAAVHGVYSADLGPDPRDSALAAKAFGQNRPRLAQLKSKYDPENVLSFACPLPKAPIAPKLIVLVTGESCAGKDHSAELWVSAITADASTSLTARTASISDSAKHGYAAATGADLKRLLEDRAYKEQHRAPLTKYFQDQLQLKPELPEKHFLGVVKDASDVDVLFITGMRDEAPLATFSHLVSDSRLLEVRVVASKITQQARGSCAAPDDQTSGADGDNAVPKAGQDSNSCPSFVFNNDTTGNEAAARFLKQCLLPLFDEDVSCLEGMVRTFYDFPGPGIAYRDVLGVAQQPGGLSLCTSLLKKHFAGDWAQIDAIACCETGGFLFSSSLATQVNIPLAVIRKAGKRPPPTVSVTKPPSFISSSGPDDSTEEKIEMSRNAVTQGSTVLVVDDVLATGETLGAMLQLLGRAGVPAENVNVLIIAEFPAHRGRQSLYERGFGKVKIQSLLVFGGD
ncbi:hypothetical protein BST61_g7724 [Cercospora zeina]